MSIANERTASLLQAQFRAMDAVPATPEGSASSTPAASHAYARFLTSLMRHGGLYTLMDSEMMTARVVPMLKAKGTDAEGAANFVKSLGTVAASFFQHLVPATFYVLDSSLISHICYPGPNDKGLPALGKTFTNDVPDAPRDLVSTFIPAAFTFIGQFIDHDLTMNAVNLFDPQTDPVQDTASPFIDLDSVYGPRSKLFNPPTLESIYERNGTFKLVTHPNGPGGKPFHDLPRETGPKVTDSNKNKALITDARNDENQLILQIHLLLLRLHNKLITDVFNKGSVEENFKATHQEVLYTWQSVILDDFLPKVLRDDVYAELREEIAKPNFGKFVYKPWLNLATGEYEASMPHEFAIGFRFGHSMLKAAYELQRGGPAIPLFNNANTPDKHGNFPDLRGTQPLIAEHVVDFTFFGRDNFSNIIDDKVTSVVFDLPESTIPDDIKFVGNLIQRNLIRSSQVGLCCGQDLAAAYKKHYPNVDLLSPADIEPDTKSQKLFVAKNQDGTPRMKDGDPEFQCPLFYYILMDAKKNGKSKESLGLVGSYLVGEVILGAIAWANVSVLKDGKPTDWTPKIPLATGGKITFMDIVNYVG